MKRHKLVVFISLVLICGGVVWLAMDHEPLPPEPIYKGRRLSAWIADVHAYEDRLGLTEEATLAVRALGTNALPFLIATLKRNDSQFKIQLYKFLAQHRLNRFQTINDWFLRTRTKRYHAAVGLRALGLGARSAIPEIVSLALNSPDENIRDEAVNALNESGEEAITLLTQALPSPDRQVRKRAAYALYWNRQAPGIAMPALTNAMTDPAAEVRAQAVASLGAYQGLAHEFIPQINLLLSDTNANVRSSASDALGWIEAKPVSTK